MQHARKSEPNGGSECVSLATTSIPGLVGWLMAVCVTVLAAALILATTSDRFDRDMFQRAYQNWPRSGEPTFWSSLATWDSAHYLFLSEVGYLPDSKSNAFYPLLPWLVRNVSWIIPSHLMAGLLVCNLCFLGGMVLFHQLIALRFGTAVGDRSLILLLLYPGSFFFHLVYSESVFFLVLMVLLTAFEKKNLPWTAAAAYLLPLARPVGFLSIVPIAWMVVRRDERRAHWSVLPAWSAGCTTHFAFMYTTTGDGFAAFTAQQFWPGNSVRNLLDPLSWLHQLCTPSAVHAYRGSLLDRCVFLGTVWCLPLIYRLDRAWFLWTTVLGIVPAMLSSFVSYTRYALLVFPVFVALGVLTLRMRPRCLRWTAAVVLVLLQAWLLKRHLDFRWAG